MKIISAQFVKSAVDPRHYPVSTLPEVAFAGRSNVGKSSLINTLVQRKGLAKTSNVPGRTQLINFFCINDQIHFVDLPGYGFAKAPESVKDTWGTMVNAYLSQTGNLRLVAFLLDIRRDPGEHDLNLHHWLEYYGIPYLLVLTKVDKMSRQQMLVRSRNILEHLKNPAVPVIHFSIRTRAGKEELWQEIKNSLCPANKA